MLYTFHADATIRDQSGQVLSHVNTKNGKTWKPKKAANIIRKFATVTPFKSEDSTFSILIQHKKKEKKHKVYILNQTGNIQNISKWFKIKTPREEWLNTNSYNQPDQSINVTIIEEKPNQAHGFFTFSFSEDVTGFTQDDIIVSGGSKGSFYSYSDDRSKYEMWIEPNSSQQDGILVITVPDEVAYSASGETNESANYSAEFDYKSPFYEWSDNFSGEYTKATTEFSIKLQFSEFIKGFQRDFLEISGGRIGKITTLRKNLEYEIELIPDPNKEYMAAINLSLDRANITDKAGNLLTLAPGDRDGTYRRFYDTKHPSAVIKQMPGSGLTANLYNGNKGTYVSIDFSEEVKGFSKDDIIVSGGQISDFQSYSSFASFYLSANENQSGTIEVLIKENSYTDLAGHTGSDSNIWTIPYDREDPFITNESFSVDPLTGIIAYRYDFSEPVNGLLAEHIDVYEATNNHHQPWQKIIADLNQSDDRKSYTISFKPSKQIGRFSTDILLPLKDDFNNRLTITSDYNYDIMYSF